MGEQAIRQPGPIQGIALLLPITMAVMGIVLLVPVMPEILHEFANVPQAPYLVQLVLTLPAGCDSSAAADLVAAMGAEVMARLGGRLRQGIEFAVSAGRS